MKRLVAKGLPVRTRLGVRVVVAVEPVDLRQSGQLASVVILELQPELRRQMQRRVLIRVDERSAVLGDESAGEVVTQRPAPPADAILVRLVKRGRDAVARPEQMTASQSGQPRANHGDSVPVTRRRRSHRRDGARRRRTERETRTRNRGAGEKPPARERLVSGRPLLELLEDGVDRKPARRCRFVHREHAPQCGGQRRPRRPASMDRTPGSVAHVLPPAPRRSARAAAG